MNKIITTAICLFLCSHGLFAHYLWLETKPQGKVGEPQEVKVYFGEYTYGVIEKVAGENYPNVKDFTLWVVDPAGKRIALEVIAKEDHYAATYTPVMEGSHTVLLNNDNIKVIDYTQYDFGIFKTHYHSMASIEVGEVATTTATQNEKGLTIQRLPGENNEVTLAVLYKGQPVKDQEVQIYVADLWSKTMHTDEAGRITFALPWDTRYIIETTRKEEVPGTFKDEDYEFIWHCATHCILPQ